MDGTDNGLARFWFKLWAMQNYDLSISGGIKQLLSLFRWLSDQKVYWSYFLIDFTLRLGLKHKALTVYCFGAIDLFCRYYMIVCLQCSIFVNPPGNYFIQLFNSLSLFVKLYNTELEQLINEITNLSLVWYLHS